MSYNKHDILRMNVMETQRFRMLCFSDMALFMR